MLKRAAGDAKDPVVIINADANATHQSVIHVMEAARRRASCTSRSRRRRRRRSDAARDEAVTFADRLVAAWYAPRVTPLAAALLWPLSLLFRAAVALRRALLPRGRAARAALPRAGRRRRQHHRRRHRQDAARRRARRRRSRSAASIRASSAAATAAARRAARAGRWRTTTRAASATSRCCFAARRACPSWIGRDRVAGGARAARRASGVRRDHRRRRPAALRARARRRDRRRRRGARLRQRLSAAGRPVARAGLAARRRRRGRALVAHRTAHAAAPRTAARRDGRTTPQPWRNVAAGATGGRPRRRWRGRDVARGRRHRQSGALLRAASRAHGHRRRRTHPFPDHHAYRRRRSRVPRGGGDPDDGEGRGKMQADSPTSAAGTCRSRRRSIPRWSPSSENKIRGSQAA